MRCSVISFVLSGLLVVACGGDDDNDDAMPDAGDPSDADPNAADGSPGQWIELVSGGWSRPAGTEGYTCIYSTVTEEVWFDGVEAIAPLGTHHTVLSFGSPTRADGVYVCNAGTNYNSMVYGSGVGTDQFIFPEGVGTRIPAGQQLLLNLHLFNASDSQLSGTSGNRVRLVDADDVDHEAQSILAGKSFGLVVPTGETTQIGNCAMSGDTTIFSMMAHMHQLGTHMKVIAQSSVAGDVTIHDAPYNFDEQIMTNLGTAVPMDQGDNLRVECSYNNTTGGTVFFGDSSEAEMCFAVIYRYPPTPGGIICSN